MRSPCRSALLQPDEAVREPAIVTAAGKMKPLNILLAEDGLVNQKLAVGLLKKYGHSVTIAVNGKEAINAMTGEDFDLVLMDVEIACDGWL